MSDTTLIRCDSSIFGLLFAMASKLQDSRHAILLGYGAFHFERSEVNVAMQSEK